MTFTIVFAASASRDMDRLPPKITSAVVQFAYGDLAAQPRRVGKPLQRELAGLYSARRGTYRILYEIDDDTIRVLVLRVDRRADAYRSL